MCLSMTELSHVRLKVLCISSRVIPIFDVELLNKVRDKIIAEWKDTRDIDSRVTWVRDCLEKRDHMTVFQLDGTNSAKDIDLAILQALLKGNIFHFESSDLKSIISKY